MINSIPKPNFERESKRIHTSLYTIVLLKLFLTLITCSSSSNPDFEKAQKINTIESYNSFIAKHPNSPQILKAN